MRITSENLESFKKQKRPEQIVTDLMNDNSFIDLIISIKKMTPTKRQDLLNKCSVIAKPTWDEMGRISPNGDGQTDAGQEAERLIAKAIVDKVKEMCNLELDELIKYYK